MKFKITVPATTANLGAAFDTAGLALNIYNTFSFDFTQKGIHYTDDLYRFETSLTLESFFKTLSILKIDHPQAVHLHTVSNIPIARGLGSSSTCIVAGVLAADYFADTQLSKERLAQIATKLEGHPDNVVSALYGSLNLSLLEDELYNLNIKVHDDLALIALVPKEAVKTQDARNILPKSYPMYEIVHNLSRLPFYEKAFKEKDETLLMLITQDKLHEPYRKTLIPNYDHIKKYLNHPLILTSWISGAGPTIMVLVDKEHQKAVMEALGPTNTQILDCQIELKGAMIK